MVGKGPKCDINLSNSQNLIHPTRKKLHRPIDLISYSSQVHSDIQEHIG